MTQGKPPVNLLDELGFVLEERAGVWVVQEDAGGCYPASLTERVLWKALLEMHQQRQCLHKISEPADASADQHPDDAAVDALAEAMKAKLAKQRARGYGGWDTPECTQQRLSDMLRGHVDKGDPVDVANFCAFLAARGEGIAQAAPAAVAVAAWRIKDTDYTSEWNDGEPTNDQLQEVKSSLPKAVIEYALLEATPQQPSQAAQVDTERGLTAFRAVINYIFGAGRNEEPLEFLRCWYGGDFSALRKEWPDAPLAIYYADPLADHAAIDAALAQS